jgi:Family of unknown function (DUF6049)
MRWARIAVGTLVVSTIALLGVGPALAASRPATGAPALVLTEQTPTVTSAAPWFSLALAVHQRGVPASQLSVSVTFYSRIGNDSELQQALGSTPDKRTYLDLPPLAVVDTGGSLAATTCVTVLPATSSTAPAAGPGSCPASAAVDYLNCTPDVGLCDGVYPVSVALLRQGSSTPLARFTTFLTYEEPGDLGNSGPLQVGLVAPVRGASAATTLGALAGHTDVPVTVQADPRTVALLAARGRHGDSAAVEELRDLTTPPGGDQLMSQPYVPVNVAALERVGLGGEISIQVERGDQLLRAAHLHPTDGTWVDTSSNLTSADAADLAGGLRVAGAGTLVLGDGDLAAGGSDNLIFAQPFGLNVGHGQHVTAVSANDALDSLFTTEPGDPDLAANQLLASLSFVHLEDPYLYDPRGVVLVPPGRWRPSGDFLDVLLAGLAHNPVLKPVTLDSLLHSVPAGGNGEPSSRRLQSGAAGAGSIAKVAVQRIALDRQHLTSFSEAVDGHPAELARLSDQLLAAESSTLTTSGRQADLTNYDQQFSHVLSAVSLASERTVTFTSRTAPIPVTVLSSAPFKVTVVLSVASDKFTFPHGSTQTLTLDRATTPVRVQAHARTSGDRLPVEVTLRTPDGLLVIARTTLTVHSTEISIVGIALTVLAGLVLLVWWGRTWRRGRRHTPRAH